MVSNSRVQHSTDQMIIALKEHKKYGTLTCEIPKRRAVSNLIQTLINHKKQCSQISSGGIPGILNMNVVDLKN